MLNPIEKFKIAILHLLCTYLNIRRVVTFHMKMQAYMHTLQFLLMKVM